MMTYLHKLKLFKWLVGFFFVWSAATIFGAAASLFYPLGQQTYGGFYWAWDSVSRQYRPSDAYIHPSLHGKLAHDTFLLQINGVPITPESDLAAVYDLFHQAAPTCAAIHAEIPPIVYTIRHDGQISTVTALPVCLNLAERLPILIPVTFMAIIVWAIAAVMYWATLRVDSSPEQAFNIAFSWTLVLTATFIGKQAYNDLGIHTIATTLMGFGVGITISVFYPISIIGTVALLPPAHPRVQKAAKIVIIALFALGLTGWLHFTTILENTPAIRLISWLHGALTLVATFASLLLIGIRAWFIRQNPEYSAQHRTQAQSLVNAAVWVPIAISLAFLRSPAKLAELPPSQPLVLATMAGFVLTVAIGVLNARTVPQATGYFRWLTLAGIWAVATSFLTEILFFEYTTGQQIIGGAIILAMLILFLRAPSRWQRSLERLTTYRTIRQEDVERYTAALQPPRSRTELTQAIPIAFQNHLGTTAATLFLPPNFPIEMPATSQATTNYPTLQNVGYTWLLPLHTAEKQIGLIALGPRPSAEPFHLSDQETLANLAFVTALALEAAEQIDQARHAVINEQDIRLEERATLSYELHDSALAQLSNLSYTLDALQLTLPHPTAEQRTLLQKSEVERQKAYQQLHHIINNLAPLRYADQTSAQFIQTLFEEAQVTHPTIHFHFQSIPNPDALLDDQQKRAMVYICKQAFDNALKHAHPHTVTITLASTATHLLFTIADDGRGFDPITAARPSYGHHGLYIMQARLLELNGRLEITTAVNQGTTITGHIPLHPQ